MKKVQFIRSVVVGFTLLFSANSQAETFPDKPIRWIVPYSAGGTTDVMARHLATEMGKTLKQTIVIENKPGAASIIGATAIARATPDGYTIGTVDSGTLAFNPALYKSLTYDAMKDFSFIGGLGKMPIVLAVNNAFPADNLAQFVDLVKKEPGKITSASSGHGSPLHMAIELFNHKQKLNLLHVPYKGSAPAVQDLMSGQINSMFVDLPPSISVIRAKKIKVLAVATPERMAILPDVPTFDEAGVKGFEAYAWQSLVGPKGMPKERLAMLNKALNDALTSDTIRQKFSEIGIQPMPMQPGQLEHFAGSEHETWGNLIREADIKLAN
ncbi:Bug family tripartite tricarboxylate transporter substrate binding protein [Advenella mimigardefordensis]|uniref:Putative Bug-like extracytoplasmic solute binding receptor, TTT family n=1 Tax=Advenella mimigardefordensis (strain DSM 17166 / LMG 22922 / DPN7) TaxID=1247726 RepID=W0PCJ9_ADVMD|nr:tripartite tricarboxylate transporter substrate binding protein [Advenella mimigardefordensis]AHG64619.1 putative Bug-like extracytoplasmic solute binding receptor, TTT family [Advenella mimigardefordensis DPN7]